jgi:RNA polymerase sigma-70 factor (ECF subfamily)
MVFPRLVRVPDPPQDALAARSDDELMTLACAGLRGAFEVLVERHAERIAALCTRFAGDAERGRELAQDTWVIAWQRRDKYRADGSFLAWLITVARNHYRNQLRRGRLVAAYEREPLHVGRQTPVQLDELLKEERRRKVREALASLPVPLREALLLRFGEGLRYDEIAGVVSVGESTLRSRVHHGLKALKRKLEKAP